MTDAEMVTLMESSKSGAEWNANCDRVKAAHGGQYPDSWYSAIVLSGVMVRTSSTWEAQR